MQALERIERDMAGGFLHIIVLATIRREGALHGYGLLKAIEATTGAPIAKEGTLYPLLATLERQGLLRSHWGAADNGPRRKDYVITVAGEHALARAAAAWRTLRDSLDTLLEDIR